MEVTAFNNIPRVLDVGNWEYLITLRVCFEALGSLEVEKTSKCCLFQNRFGVYFEALTCEDSL